MASDLERGYASPTHQNRSTDNVELQHLRNDSIASLSEQTNVDVDEHHPGNGGPGGGEDRGFMGPTLDAVEEFIGRERTFWNRLKGRGRKWVPWGESFKNALMSSYINIFLIFLPFAWAGHFLQDKKEGWGHSTVFALCFLSIIPLEKMFDWGGEQMALYLGKQLGDWLIISLNNAVEGALAIILLVHCELRLLQSTIVGVIILHLLLIPGTAFLAGGAQIWEQNLHPHPTQLNHSLLTIGVLTILLPTAFFAALDRGAVSFTSAGETVFGGNLISDGTRRDMLQMSRGLAVVLLLVYFASRIFIANPPGDDNALRPGPNAPEELKKRETELFEEEPEINPGACIAVLVVTVAIMATTAEFLVESIEFVRESGGIQEEWFGLILLPIVSFSADGVVAIVYFIRALIGHFRGTKPMVPSTLAKARAIDMSIQFVLFWMPFLVLLAWWDTKPFHLVFDYFELALLLGSCFLVNYVTADSKTNWVEGLIMVSFYIMIATCSWFYTGQPELEAMLTCPDSVSSFLAGEEAGGAAGEGAEGAVELVRRIIS